MPQCYCKILELQILLKEQRVPLRVLFHVFLNKCFCFRFLATFSLTCKLFYNELHKKTFEMHAINVANI